MSINAFEVSARDKKVSACIAYLDGRKNAHDLDDAKLLQIVEKFDDGLWAELAERAEQNPLSETSRAVLLDRLRGRVSG